jgi:hypothetical protein
MIEQSSVHLPELVKDIGRPVSNYLVHLSRTRNLVEEPGPEVQQHQPYEHLEGVWVREQLHFLLIKRLSIAEQRSNEVVLEGVGTLIIINTPHQ